MICTVHQILFGEITSRRMTGSGHVARMGERCIQGFGGET